MTTFNDLITSLTWYQKLAILRILKGLTMIEISKDLGIDVDTYRGWESGNHSPQRLGRKVLANYYGLPENEIFGDMREV